VTPTEALILGILREAKETGAISLTRTVLHKFVYLADLYQAEETQGKTFTGESWKFLHFGPFANAVARSMDGLVSSQALFADTRTPQDDDAEFVVYSLRGPGGPRLREIGLASPVALRLDSDLRRFAKNLPALLDFVYFRTWPMEKAKPGDTLDFSQCVKLATAEFRPVEMLPLTQGKIKRTREKLRAILKTLPPAQNIELGPIDEVYLAGIAALSSDSLPEGFAGFAEIDDDA
jgi:hypothetical protein